MSDPSLSFRIPQDLRDSLESRSTLTGSTVTAIILDSWGQTLSAPPAPREVGRIEEAVERLYEGWETDDAAEVKHAVALMLASVADKGGPASVNAARELLALLDDATDDGQAAEIAAFKSELAAAVAGSGRGNGQGS